MDDAYCDVSARVCGCWNAFISREKAHDLFSRLSFCSSSSSSFDHFVSFSFRLVSLYINSVPSPPFYSVLHTLYSHLCFNLPVFRLLPSSSPLISMPRFYIFLDYSVPFHRLPLPYFSCYFFLIPFS